MTATCQLDKILRCAQEIVLHCVQNDKREYVIGSDSEESYAIDRCPLA